MDEQGVPVLSTDGEIDRILLEKISRLSQEKLAYLLEWIKKEFPEQE